MSAGMIRSLDICKYQTVYILDRSAPFLFMLIGSCSERNNLYYQHLMPPWTALPSWKSEQFLTEMQFSFSPNTSLHSAEVTLHPFVFVNI